MIRRELGRVIRHFKAEFNGKSNGRGPESSRALVLEILEDRQKSLYIIYSLQFTSAHLGDAFVYNLVISISPVRCLSDNICWVYQTHSLKDKELLIA